jgi:hypothetical protein
MDQDRGDRGGRGSEQRGKASISQRWREIRLTKTAVFWSCVASMVFTMIVGFAWGGWVTGGTAQTMADKIAQDAVVKRLAPMCVVQYNRDPGKVQKLIELKAAGTWQAGDYVEKQGWATMVGEEKPDSAVASECARLLLLVSK